jgi:transcriptional regulator with XRE-family HTH domain
VTLGEKITALRLRRGWSQNQLAERAGIDKGHLSKIVRGTYPNPGRTTLLKLSAALGESIEMITGDHPFPMVRPTTVIESVVVIPVSTIRVHADGQPEYDDTPETVSTLAKNALTRASNLRAAVVTGTCMHPDVNPGDVVIFDPGALTPVDGQMVVVLTADGDTLIKWFRRDELGRPYLRARDGTMLRPNGAKIIGTVVDISRRPIRDPELNSSRRNPGTSEP